MSKHISVILPCYQPAPDWVETVRLHFNEIKTTLPDVKFDLIIVNDGSDFFVDKRIVEREIIGVKYITYKENRGKGFALRKGVAAVNADIYIYTDVDFPYNKESFVKIVKILLDDELDIAAGVKNRSYYQHLGFARRNISRLLQWMTRMFMRLPNADTQCGLKGFNEKGRKVFLSIEIDRYLFDLEFIKRASKEKGLRLGFIETELRKGVHFSRFNTRVLLVEFLNFLKLWWKG